MNYRIVGLAPTLFRRYGAMNDAELRQVGGVRMVAGADSDFPCRISLRNVPIGARSLLLNYEHQPAGSPYRSSGPIFVWEDATDRYDKVGQLPESVRPRLYALRSYDAGGMMVEADLVEGADMEGMIERLLADPIVSYLHAHHARRGCYAFLVERA